MNRLSVKCRLYPNHAQQRTLNETLAVCRQVYNSMVHERTVCYQVQDKSPSMRDQKKEMTQWKKSHKELTTVHSQVLQNVAVRVELAFQAFFRRVRDGEEPGYPRLKGSGQYDRSPTRKQDTPSGKAVSHSPRSGRSRPKSIAPVLAQSKPALTARMARNGTSACLVNMKPCRFLLARSPSALMLG